MSDVSETGSPEVEAPKGRYQDGALLGIGRDVVAVLSSHATVCVLLLLLGLLTFFGTLEQQHLNLHDVQAKYFDSAFVMAAGVFPLPGAYLLLAVLFLSLIVGGFVRMRWTLSRVGILVIHLGMALLLLAGFIEFQFSTKGYLSLVEQEDFKDENDNGQYDKGEPFFDYDENGRWTPGQTANYFVSYFLHDFVVVQHGKEGAREYLIPYEKLETAGDAPVTFRHPDLPVDVVVSGFARNAAPMRTPPGAAFGVRGMALRELPPDPDKAERHLPGFYASLKSKKPGARAVREIVWAGQRYPARVAVADGIWDLDLRRRRYPLPFHVQLHDAVHKRYPGTGMSKEYSSHVSKIDNDVAEPWHITMNEPLRHKGFTLYQSQYDEREGGPDESGFSVSQNPADRIPMIACIIIAAGLLYHFVRKLFLYIKGQQRRRATA